MIIQGVLTPGNSLSLEHIGGNMPVLCAAASESIFNTLSRISAVKAAADLKELSSPIVQTSIVSAIALILCLIPALFEHPLKALSGIGLVEWLVLLWYGVFVTALAFICWYSGIKRCGCLFRENSEYTNHRKGTGNRIMDIFINEAGEAEKCRIGILVMENVQNKASKDKLRPVRQELEAKIRSEYANASRGELKALHPMNAYISYYKKYGHTYHVLPQLESVIKGKAIPDGLPLVEAMFMAEVKNMLLTAGHDYDKIKAPLSLRISTGVESYTTMNGKDSTTISGDFMITDYENVISSILRGPDQRTAITEDTTRVIYTVYAPFDIEEHLVQEHLKEIEAYVRIVSEKSSTCLSQVFKGMR